MKEVTIGIKVDSEFVAQLRTVLTLQNVFEKDRLNALEALGVAVYGESRGAPYEQTYLRIPPEWRRNIDIVPEIRKVEEINDEIKERDAKDDDETIEKILSEKEKTKKNEKNTKEEQEKSLRSIIQNLSKKGNGAPLDMVYRAAEIHGIVAVHDIIDNWENYGDAYEPSEGVIKLIK